MRVVVLRPEPGASATVARARALGLAAEARPLFAIEPLAWTAPDPSGFDGLLLTSANAVRAAGAGLTFLRELLVYAVGTATAEAARAAGLIVAATGDGGVGALLAGLPPTLRLLHLAGEDRIEVEAAQPITVVPVYRSAPVDPAPDLGATAPALFLVHSPRAGRRLAEIVGERGGCRIAAISAAAAAACGPGWDSVAAADRPNDSSLLSLAARLCQHPQPK